MPQPRSRPRKGTDSRNHWAATSSILHAPNLHDYRAELGEWEAAFRALGYPWKMTSGGIKTKCPVHDGKSDNSLSIGRSYQNRIMVHCFGNPGLGGESTCTYRAIKQTVGLWEDRPQMFGG